MLNKEMVCKNEIIEEIQNLNNKMDDGFCIER